MRIKVTLTSGTDLVLPIHYNHLIQGLIYRNLDPKLAREIHDRGRVVGKRRFKMFAFSRLFGKARIKGSDISFKGRIHLWIATPDNRILESFAGTIIKKQRIKLGESFVSPSSIEVAARPEFKDSVLVRTLSPITVYSTLKRPDGRKKTYYYSPFEQDFSVMVRNNLYKKYQLIKGVESEGLDLEVVPERVGKRDLHIIIFKGTVIKAWSGIYRLKGSKELIEIGYDCGLGAKNSQGFGMIDLV